MTRSPSTFNTPCPFGDGEDCPNTLTVTAYPAVPMRIALDSDDSDPGSPADLEVEGCPHVEHRWDGCEECKRVDAALWEIVNTRAENARTAAIDARIDEALGK